MFYIFSRISFILLVISSINCAGITHPTPLVNVPGRNCITYQKAQCHGHAGNTYACYECRDADQEIEPN